MSISLEFLLLMLSILFFISMLATKASAKLGVPVLLLFLGVGMLFGSDGLGLIFDNLQAAQAVGTVALSIILFSGGMDTKFNDIKPVIKPGLTLATFSVLIVTICTGLFIWQFTTYFTPLNFNLLESMLLAAVMSSTDSASVFNILRSKGVSLKNNLRPLLELESGSNDPMAYMLTITFIGLIMSPAEASVIGVVANLLIQLSVGALAGYILGKLGVKLMNKINLTNDALYPILLFAICVFIFSFTYFIKGNGYLAVYIAGLVVGNSKFMTKRTSVKFFDGQAWLSQIMMFLTLGLLVNPHELIDVIIPGLAIAAFMIFVGRPISVFLGMLPFHYNRKSMTFVSWVGLKGAVPIVFAIMPLAAGIPHAREMFNIVFFITLLSLLLQGSSLTLVANWLKLSGDPTHEFKLKDFDMEFSEEIKSSMTEITIGEKQLEQGKCLMDMALPDKTLAVMVKRGSNNYFIPKGHTELQIGDKLLVITDDEKTLRETYKAMGLQYNMRR
jgi:cell volume regulation protein A